MMRRAFQAAMQQRRRGLVALAIGAALATPWLLQQWRGDELSHITDSTMGTTYAVTYRGGDVSSRALKHQITAKLKAIENALSNWQDNSWIGRFNRRNTTGPMAAPPHARRVLQIALRLAERTNGALDPTLGRLINLWGFGPVDRQGRPSADAIEKALATAGYEKLRLTADPPRLSKTHPRLALNLSAVAKGYAVDVLAEHLEAKDIQHYLINLGGDIKAKGHPPNKNAWQVAIQRPSPSANAQQTESTVALKNQALATSGDYRRYITVDGQRFPHILDPATGRPARSALASASITAPTAARADGLATACVVMGLPRARQCIETLPNVEALFIERVQPNRFKVHVTKAWDASQSPSRDQQSQ
jgi:thiamine biosynthesis lipoprotein